MKLIRRYALLGLITACNVTFMVTAATKTQKESIKNVSFKKIYTLKGHKDIVQSMKMLKDGSLVSGSADTTMRIWNVNGVCLKHWYNHAGWINIVDQLIDGRIICGSNEGSIKIWDCNSETYATLPNLEKENTYANSVIQLHSGNIAFNTWQRAIKIWDVNKDICLKTFGQEQHKACISSLIELEKTDYLATASWDGTIKIWGMSQDKSMCIKTFERHTDCVNVVRQLNDQTLVSAADDNTIIVWDIDSGKNKATLRGHTDKVYALLVVHEKILSGSRDKTVKIWDPNSQSCLATIPCEDKVYSLAFTPKEQYLFVGLGSGDIEVFNLVLTV